MNADDLLNEGWKANKGCFEYKVNVPNSSDVEIWRLCFDSFETDITVRMNQESIKVAEQVYLGKTPKDLEALQFLQDWLGIKHIS